MTILSGLIEALAEVGSRTALGRYLQTLSQKVVALDAKSSRVLTYTLDSAALNAAPLGTPTLLVMGTIMEHCVLLGFSYTLSNDPASIGSIEAQAATIGSGLNGFPIVPPSAPGDGANNTQPLGFLEAFPGTVVDTIIQRTVGVLAPGTTITIQIFSSPIFP